MRTDEEAEGYQYRSSFPTPRLNLRPTDANDREAIAALAANPRVAASLVSALAARQGCPGGGGFSVVERETGAVIGGAEFWPVPDMPGTVELTAFLGEAWWGRGYATEAAQGLVEAIFADPRIRVLWCVSRASNPRARRVVEKCGFQFRGGGMVRGQSGAVPVERFLLERRTWESLMAWGAGSAERRRRFDAPRDNAA